MSQDLAMRRRAIYTGLKPYLPEAELLDALLHWESHYANAPRFTLQRFVSELCREGELRSRRADVLLSLVQAMSMPPQSLLPDPMQHVRAGKKQGDDDVQAFRLLIETLLEITSKDPRYSLRLDLIASLDTRKLSTPVAHALQRWLADKAPLTLSAVEISVLRALVNRTYVILCEREGPVTTDKLLATAVDKVAANGLGDAVRHLL
jgi:hypothetical protein